MRASWSGIVSCGLAVLVAACTAEQSGTVAGVPAVQDEATLVAYDAAWGYTWVNPVPDVTFFPSGAFDPVMAAGTATAAISGTFTPIGCAVATASGAVVTTTLRACNGPIQLISVSGTITTTYSDVNNAPQVQISGMSVLINSTPFNIAITGTVGRSGGNRTFTYVSTSQPSGFPANSRSVSGTMTWAVGSGCVTVNETRTTTISGVTYDVSLMGYQQCTAACPTAGALTLTAPANTLSVAFDGSPTPTVADGKGDSGTAILLCQ